MSGLRRAVHHVKGWTATEKDRKKLHKAKEDG